MIVREQPSALSLFFVMQGSIVPRILHKIVAVTLLSMAIYLLDRYATPLPQIPFFAISVFGLALSLFLGFRNNAAYERWWEARKLWGQLIADVRNLGRQVVIFEVDVTLRADLMKTAAGFAHLHRSYLRGDDVRKDIEALLGEEQALRLLKSANSADAALRDIAANIAKADLSGFARMALGQTLANIGLAQAGCERIASTPLPFVYSLLVRRTTYLYCFLLPFALAGSAGWFTPLVAAVVAYVFFGLQAVTRELEHPFADTANGLPLDTMCRVIEISVAESLGNATPPPLEPQGFVLT